MDTEDQVRVDLQHRARRVAGRHPPRQGSARTHVPTRGGLASVIHMVTAGAVLPCYWIYARVGEELVARRSPDPLYARWTAMYGGAEFQAVVGAVLEVTDRVGATLSDAELARMREHHRTTARYEWMFWDAGLRRETWPV
jgi:thiaminase